MSAVAKLYKCAQTHYKHNEDGLTAPDVRGHGSVPLIHSGNVVTINWIAHAIVVKSIGISGGCMFDIGHSLAGMPLNSINPHVD